MLAGWGRAILLQLAHPLVGQGVADHSGFARDLKGMGIGQQSGLSEGKATARLLQEVLR